MNKKGQGAFIGLILAVMGIIVFILALPWISAFVGYGASEAGTASGFFIRLFPFVILALLVFAGYRAIAGSPN